MVFKKLKKQNKYIFLNESSAKENLNTLLDQCCRVFKWDFSFENYCIFPHSISFMKSNH